LPRSKRHIASIADDRRAGLNVTRALRGITGSIPVSVAHM
jgi:hypothetical protein